MINLFLIVCVLLWGFSLWKLGKILDVNYKTTSSPKFLIPYLSFYIGFSIITFSLIIILQYFPGLLNFWGRFGNNLSHHMVFFRGFEKSDTSVFHLINEQEPNRAIYPGLKGNLSIRSSSASKTFSIQSDNLTYPLFVSTDSTPKMIERKWVLKKNAGAQLLIAENNGAIFISSANPAETDTINYNISAADEKKQEYNLYFSYKGQTDSVKNKTISYGVQLNALLENTHLPISGNLMEKTYRVLLLKDTVGYEKDASRGVKLKWCGGENPLIAYWQQKIPLQRPDEIRIVSANYNTAIWPIAGRTQVNDLPQGAAFYLGVDPAGGTRTNEQMIFSLSRISEGRMGMDFIQPSVYPLPGPDNPYINKNTDTSSIFITSNVKGIWQQTNLMPTIIFFLYQVRKRMKAMRQ